MSEHEKTTSRSWRLRFSLFSMLLLMALVGLAIVVVQMWREVGPLRAENRRMRAELGYLSIDDPAQAYAMMLPTAVDDIWRWRIYLPPGAQHTMYEYQGKLPRRGGREISEWLEEVKNSGPGTSSTGSNLQGEILIDAALVKSNNQWQFVQSFMQGFAGYTSKTTMPIEQTSIDWLSVSRGRRRESNLIGQQKVFKPGEPILLLYLGREDPARTTSGRRLREPPKDPTQAFVVWIEPAAAPVPAK